MKKVIGIALASMLVAATAQAADQTAADENFSALDADQNGSISEKEAAVDGALAASFAKVDIDQNGEISHQEYIMGSGGATAAGQ